MESTEKLNNVFWNRTHDLPACSLVPQPTTQPIGLTKLQFEVPYLFESRSILLVLKLDGKLIRIGFQKQNNAFLIKAVRCYIQAAFPELDY
jgi:hypothetical protein